MTWRQRNYSALIFFDDLRELGKFGEYEIELRRKLLHHLILPVYLLLNFVAIYVISFPSVVLRLSHFLLVGLSSLAHFGVYFYKQSQWPDEVFDDLLLYNYCAEVCRWSQFVLGIVFHHQRAQLDPLDKQIDHIDPYEGIYKKYHPVILVYVCIVINLFENLQDILDTLICQLSSIHGWYFVVLTVFFRSSIDLQSSLEEALKDFFWPFKIGFF